MATTLTLHKLRWTADCPILDDQPFFYRVDGMPTDYKASIAKWKHEGWHILLRNHKAGLRGRWIGMYETAETALETLQKTFDLLKR